MDKKELVNCLEKKEQKKTMLNALLRYEKKLLEQVKEKKNI
jgi:hypothetical protein